MGGQGYVKQREVVPISSAFERLAFCLQPEGMGDTDYSPYEDDPIGFVEDVLGLDLTDQQKEFLGAIRDDDRITIRSCNAVGKTTIVACAVIWFLHTYRPSTVVTTAPTGRQVEIILWKEIARIYNGSKKPLGGRLLTLRLDMSNKEKWFGVGFSTDQHRLEAFQGFHNVNILVIVDEASGVETPIYEAIEGVIASGEIAKLVLIGNPTDEVTKFGDSFKTTTYRKFHVEAYDTPNFTEFGITEEDIINNTWEEKIDGPLPRPYLISPKWAYQMMDDWGIDSPLYQVRVKGNFPEISADTLIPLSWIERAQRKTVFPQTEDIKALGVDVSRSGDDETVVIMRHGNRIEKMWTWIKHDTMFTANQVARIIQDEEIPPQYVNVDVIGLGAGVVDRLREMGFWVNGVNVEERAFSPLFFANSRAEMFWELRQLFEDDKIEMLDDDILKGELAGFKYQYRGGKLWLEPKAETKKRVKKSPDRADALAMCIYVRPDVSFADLGDLQHRGAEAASPDTLENQYGIPYNINDVKRKVTERLTPKPREFLEKCPHCDKSAGLVYRKGSSAASPEEAEHRKCLICRISWVKERGEWKEETNVQLFPRV